MNGYCRFEGDLLDNFELIEDKNVCLSACKLNEKCNYFLHNSALKNCQLMAITGKQCDLKGGPPTPDLSTCQGTPTPNPTSTTSRTTSTTEITPKSGNIFHEIIYKCEMNFDLIS